MFKAAIPRDRVYGLLGLSNNMGRRKTTVVYTVSEHVPLQQVARYVLLEEQSLDYLLTAGTGLLWPEGNQPDPKHPSSVPPRQHAFDGISPSISPSISNTALHINMAFDFATRRGTWPDLYSRDASDALQTLITIKVDESDPRQVPVKQEMLASAKRALEAVQLGSKFWGRNTLVIISEASKVGKIAGIEDTMKFMWHKIFNEINTADVL